MPGNGPHSDALRGRRIVVTRSPAQAPAFCAKLEAHGATAIAIPAIRFEALDATPLLAALAQIERYAWLLLTSGNAVDYFFTSYDGDQYTLNGVKIGSVGSATAKKLAARGIDVDFMPDEFTGEDLVDGLGDIDGQRVLLPRARIGRPEIVQRLQEKGAIVDDIPLYDTVRAQASAADVAALEAGIDMVTFTSPSSVRNFLALVAEGSEQAVQKVHAAAVCCIGPVTAEEAEERGLTVDVVPEDYTIEGMVQGILAHYEEYT